MKLTIYQDGSPTVLEYSTPVRLSTLFAGAHIPLAMPCGGQRRCHKCKVIAHGALSSLSEEESKLLTPEEVARGIRFACMTTVLGDAEIVLPDQAQQRIVTTGQLPDFPALPVVGRLWHCL